MTLSTSPPATLFPPWVVDELRAAAARRDHEEIDRLTDALASAGLVRMRHDASRFESVAQFNEQGRASA